MSASEVAASRPYPYPGVRAGGLFLLVVGAFILVGAGVGPQGFATLFYTGLGAGLLAFVLFGGRLCRPRGAFARTRAQLLAIPAAILLEVALILLVQWLLKGQLAHGQTRSLDVGTLLAVGAHFAVFAILFGPLLLLLTALCCANALIGLLFPTVPLMALYAVDGAIKVATGIAMLRTRSATA